MLNVSPYSDLYRPMAWFPGAYDLRVLSWAHVRVWGAAGGGCHAGFAGECALCAFLLCKSCFIRDIDRTFGHREV